MTKNIGTTDRIIRAILGVGLIVLAAADVTMWGWIGVPVLLTAAIGWCPPYALLGINTCGTKRLA